MRALIDEQLQLLAEPKILLLGQVPWLRFIPLFWHFGMDVLHRNITTYWTFLQQHVDRCKNEFELSKEADNFVAAYLKEMQERESAGKDLGWFSAKQLLATVSDFWVAGQKTTVTTLRWAILYMVHNADVQEKVQQELDNFTSQEEQLTMNDRSVLPYTAATIQEIQRLANILPINLQHTVCEEVQINGFTIPKGTAVIPQISAVLMDPELFPKPGKFDPDRFLTNDGILKKVEELIPFSLGKRLCLGESLARMELFLIFASLMRHFKFCKVPGEELPTLEAKPAFTRQPKHCRVMVLKR